MRYRGNSINEIWEYKIGNIPNLEHYLQKVADLDFKPPNFNVWQPSIIKVTLHGLIKDHAWKLELRYLLELAPCQLMIT